MTNFISTKTTDDGEIAVIPCFIPKTKVYEFRKSSHCNIKIKKEERGFILERKAGIKEIPGLDSDEMNNELIEFFNGTIAVKQQN